MIATRILAAVERFPQDDAVLVRGFEIANRLGAVLTIVHVMELPDHAVARALADTFRCQSDFAARGRIVAALRRNGIGTAGTEIRIEAGSPAQRLVEICDEFAPELVVMRANQKTRILEKLLGSTTQAVLAAGTVPVLIVKQASGKPYGRVILAVDGPDYVPDVLTVVTSLLPDAALELVQAVKVPPQLEAAMLRVGLAQTELTAHRDALADEAEKRLGSLTAGLRHGLEWQVLRGDPAEELIRVTQSPDTDLITLGPNRSSLIRCAFTGSVTQRLLRDAACDVLICRPAEARSPRALTTEPSTRPVHGQQSLPLYQGGTYDH
ncbi:universal stress protein [Leisingera caerulea]|uniref:universal stress protein n=1 Tax=Leisingera caerulea TaxID=506591 RepID=UPI00042091F9|nr:universal stress protein [Leisingera caerulea]